MTAYSETQAAALLRYVELFLDEVESRERGLDARECDLLAEIFVRLAVADYDCVDLTRQLEVLLAEDAAPKERISLRADPDLPTVEEYRSLLTLVRSRT
jgi:hypothetical protein